MADSDVQVAPEGAGPHVDAREFDRGGTPIRQQAVALGNGTDGVTADVLTAAPGAGAQGLVTRNIPSGTQPVSMAALGPDQATESGVQDVVTGLVDVVNGLTALLSRLPAALAAGGGLKVEGVAGGAAVPVQATTLPLPAGAATQVTLAAVLAALGATLDVDATGSVVSIAGTVPMSALALPLPTGAATQVTLAAVLAALGATLAVDASGHNLTIGGTVAVSALALPLPAGAATEVTLAAMSAKLPAALIGGRLPVDVGASVLPTGAATEATVAGIKTGTDKIPASPATDRATAAAPAAVRLSDGAAFYAGATETTLAAAAASLAAIDAGIPNALAANGGMKIEGVAGGVAVPTSLAALPARARTTDAIAAALQTDAIMNGFTALTPKFASIELAADGALVAAVGGKKIRPLCLFLNSDIDGKINLRTTSAAGTKLCGDLTVRSGGGFVLPFCPVGWCETISGDGLFADITTLTKLSGLIVYVEV